MTTLSSNPFVSSRNTMTRPITTRLFSLGAALLAAAVVAGCGPTFDPASLIEKTRVLGARVTVDGAPERAAPALINAIRWQSP